MAQLKKILLVDDDEDLREALSEQLGDDRRFRCLSKPVTEGLRPWNAHARAIYDLVILDVVLPDTDGRELCRLMRKQGVKSPILMLTGHDSDADTILGLDAGAPMTMSPNRSSSRFFWPAFARNCASMSNPKTPSLYLGPYTFKPAMKMLITEDDRKIRLTEKETNISEIPLSLDRWRGGPRCAAARGLGL